MSRFPAEFFWGAATASFQIEGGRAERGECIWDRFCQIPGRVRNGDTGDIACDHYHRARQDVALMREMGLRAYRFSVSWPRVIPDGTGSVQSVGIDFYDRLVDDLLQAGITPFITLYHWDLPQPLEDAGGWPERRTVDAFTRYVEVLVRRLGDRVRHWITHNEPWVAAWLGYGWGIHAPGRAEKSAALLAAHHFLLSHGRAVNVLRREVPEAQVGITLNFTPVYPATESEADRRATIEADGSGNRWFLDPLYRGKYPSDALELYGSSMPPVDMADMDDICRPTDFLGVNLYSRRIVRADEETGRPVTVRAAGKHTAMDWEVYPNALRDLLLRLRREYGVEKMYVTENGAAYDDVRRHDGAVLDPERWSFLEQNIAALGEAIDRGAPVEGYFVWSLLDNFEWAYGYQKRFGLVYVDYPTLERIPKSSAARYRDFIAGQS